jgi:hypothetical protein
METRLKVRLHLDHSGNRHLVLPYISRLLLFKNSTSPSTAIPNPTTPVFSGSWRYRIHQTLEPPIRIDFGNASHISGQLLT